MSEENVPENALLLQGAVNDNNNNNDDEESTPPPARVEDSSGAGNPTMAQQSSSSDQQRRPPMQSNELQRRRTEALERILMGADSNLSLPHPTARRLRFEGARRLRGQHRHFLNRSLLPRRDIERAIFIPFRTRSSMSALNLPTSQDSDSASTSNNLTVNNLNEDAFRREGSRSGNNRPRINVSTFFMELTYTTAEPNGMHLLKNSTEGQKRRLEIHAANTMNIIKQYCPTKPHKFNQFRCCAKTQREDIFDFQNVSYKPLDALDPMQLKCNTKVVVIIKEDASGKWNSPFTPYFMSALAKKHLNPTCLTFQSDTLLNTLVEQLNDDLHVFPKDANANDPVFNAQAKRFLVMSTLAKLVENWSAPLIVLDSCVSKLTGLDEIVEFCKRFQIRLIDVDSSISSGNSKQKKAGAKRLRHQVRKALIESNIKRVGEDMKRIQKKMITEIQHTTSNSNVNSIDPTLISEDCRRIVFNLHERMSNSLSQTGQKKAPPRHANRIASVPADVTARISLLEDEILADIENSDAFKCSRSVQTPTSGRMGTASGEGGRTARESGESRPKTSHSIYDESSLTRHPTTPALPPFSTPLVREQEKISELLFNELNQRWRLHGPQRFVPRSDAGPYCSGMSDSEKQLLLSIIQEVAYFETLKDIRNELKDSKKDLEGRLYGYNPDFANLIASAEEFLHGKAACMEPCKNEMQFYKMPVSLVLSEAEVKYLRSKPPTYVVGQESPNQFIRVAIEESTKLFLDAIIRTTSGTRRLSSSRRNRTKVIIVIEDNNEALELLTVALWFFEKTPLATFQSKYYYNTSDFLLSLDACRFYFRSYPAHSTKKDEERIFERWLGVGMNGILRSHQNKIMLIDFPRLGSHLQNSKNILVNRLKIEEKLNNIKSFIICKPSRKEDNLSTVEKLMDEIQKVLEPRDKLLFRKSRRMYMDLKLYKQIEQKSRQDLKALRDWGLPEPENEHELWEKLRNSELVINDIQPSRESDITESYEISETANLDSSCGYEDTSEPESVLADKSETSKRSGSEDVNLLSECDESMESITVGDDQLSVTEDAHHYFTTLQFHANRSGGFGRRTATDSHRGCSSSGESVNERLNKNRQRYNFEAIDSNPDDIEVTASRLDFNELQGMQNAPESSLPANGVELNSSTNVSPNLTLRRSAGILNLLDKGTFTEESKSFATTKNNVRTRKCFDVTDCEMQTDAFTKLEFTLPPKYTSDEGVSSSSSNSLLTKSPQPKERSVKRKKSFLLSGSKNVEMEIEDENTNDQNSSHINAGVNATPSNKKNLPELCVAYISKWGKSLSRALHKRTFPEKLSFPLHLSIRKIKKPQSRLMVPRMSPEKEEVQDAKMSSGSQSHTKEDTNVQPSEELLHDKRERSSNAWFRNLLSHFRVKAHKRQHANNSENQDLAN